MSENVASQKESRETVVLVHGLAASKLVLKPLESSLQQQDFATINWGYRSILGEIDSLSRSFRKQIERLDEDGSCENFHLVTHSMGSIIVRAALADWKPKRLRRIVMVGPPHAGSRVASKLSRYLGWLCRPLRQLSDEPKSYVNSLPIPRGYDIGIIAASRDRVVRLESTCLESQSDHIVVDGGHTSILFRRDTAMLVESFLRSGQFQRRQASA